MFGPDIPFTNFTNVGTIRADLRMIPPDATNPPVGTLRLFANQTTGQFSVIDSNGNSALPPVAPGSAIDGGIY
jgi:hypothetical protein